MIKLETNLEGKQALFGEACQLFSQHDITMGGNWDFDRGMFDSILFQDKGTTIYLRIPFDVIRGELDAEDALISFTTPFVIKHIANIGLDTDESPVLTTAGLDQFQSPIAKDAAIEKKDKWAVEGERRVAEFADDLIFIRAS